MAEAIKELEFPDNRLLIHLFGTHDEHLIALEKALSIIVRNQGNRLTMSGALPQLRIAESILQHFYHHLEANHSWQEEEWQAALEAATHNSHDYTTSPDRLGTDKLGPDRLGLDKQWLLHLPKPLAGLMTARGKITARTPNQHNYVQAMQHYELVFASGPAGTGKTWLAVAAAIEALQQQRVERIILTRPAVEAGEKLGFLPGALKDKVDPYLRPLYDALHELLGPEMVQRKLESGEIEIAPLAYMRGRNLNRAFIIMDEAQNTTPLQMKMFLTRLGRHSRMVITGDVSQIDLPQGQMSGLIHAIKHLANLQGIGVCQLTADDVMRHPLVAAIIRAYEAAPSETIKC